MKDLWVPLSGAIASQRQVETIANNVANANTAGFKRDDITFKEYLTALDKGVDDIDIPNKEWAPEDFYHSQGAENAQVKVSGTFTIFEQGNLTPSGNPLDFALRGPGFFELQTHNGARYSRAGVFAVDPDGYLITQNGDYVLSKLTLPEDADQEGTTLPPLESRRIQVPPGTRVNANLQGELFANGAKIGDLSIVEFKDIHALRKEGTGKFINADIKNIKTDSNSKTAVYQGFVEQSNVNAVEEMAKLIKANRHFESIQRVIKTYDNISGKGTNEIAKF